MADHRFIAFALPGELDLNKLAPRFGSSRKYRWDEPMLVDPSTLKLISGERLEREQAYLYYFGGVVFLNCADETILSFAREMEKVTETFKGFLNIKHQESYYLRVEEGAAYAVTNDYALLPDYDQAFVDIIAFVIAKSVALERIEEQVVNVLDEVEEVIALLDQGKFSIPDRTLAKLASRILDFKYRSVAYVMVLDKPEITWQNHEADRLYMTMANMFELNQRYQEIKHKSETLMDITDVFTSLSHASREIRLEWIIVILIVLEIFISLYQLK